MAAPKKLAHDVEFRDINSRRVAGFLNTVQLAKVLDVHQDRLKKYMREDLFRPDFYSQTTFFFAEARLEEIKAKWADRRSAFPVSGPVKGVITSFGMMLPRVAPKKEVLERLMKLRPKRALRDSSWKTRRHYNLKDLTP